MVIIILDEFFIRFSNLLINSFIRIIDFIVLLLNKFNLNSNSDGENDKEEVRFENMGIFKINHFLKNDSIFEELERKYSRDSSSSLSNQYNQSQNIFTSLDIGKKEDLEFSDEIKSDLFSDIKEKSIDLLMNGKHISINESNVHGSILRIVAVLFLFITIIAVLISYFLSFELGLAVFITFLLIAFAIFYYPKIKRQNKSSSFSRELPYALRQLATELRSGKSLFDSMASIVDSDYGILSFEFSRVLEEIKYGETTEAAFLNLEKRVDSQAFSRVVYEILTSLRIGANLSASLTVIADDINFDIRMKLKEYSEKLNAFIMIYTFLAILAPVILLTMLLASSVVIGDLVPGDLVLILYSVFFPMIIVFLGFAIKKLEPKV